MKMTIALKAMIDNSKCLDFMAAEEIKDMHERANKRLAATLAKKLAPKTK